MKTRFIKSFIAAVLLASCVMGGTACTQNGQPADTKKQEETENTNKTPKSSSALGSTQNGSEYSFFIRLDGIEGESKDVNHMKWINVIDFSHGTAQEMQSGMPMSSDKGNYEPIVFTHTVDAATPKLQRYCMNNNRIISGEFNAVKSVSGQQTVFYKVEFSYLTIVNSEVKTVIAEDGSSRLVEEVTMFAEKESVNAGTDYPTDGRSGLSYYVKLDGIEGECSESAHNKWIKATELSHGAEQEIIPEIPATTGNGTFKPIVFVHRIDKSASMLQDSCLKGLWIGHGEFQAAKSVAGKETVIYAVKLDNFKIVKAVVRTVTDSSGSSYLAEEVTLLAEKETWTYNLIGLDDSISGKSEAEFDQTKRS